MRRGSAELVAEGGGKGGDFAQVGDARPIQGVVDLFGAEGGLEGAEDITELGQFHTQQGLLHLIRLWHGQAAVLFRGAFGEENPEGVSA